MEKGLKPIPALYACYLLRSTVRHASLYVGSTPNPPRRLKQHNGESKGGAAKTSKDSLRPWEMTCLVTGFPSKIAALQFEWAWQNTHLTRHISPNSRISKTRVTVRFSPKTGRARKRGAKPRLSLTDRLANLHLLLEASSFQRWPLDVTFYAADVYRVWRSWADRHAESLDEHITVRLDEPTLRPQCDDDNNCMVDDADRYQVQGIHALQTDYRDLNSQLQRTQSLFEQASPLACAICDSVVPSRGEGVLVCPNSRCATTTHLACLSRSFLESENQSDAMIPVLGRCPGCQVELRWVDLVKELTLRMRGETEIRKVLKQPNARKGQVHGENLRKNIVDVEVDENSDDRSMTDDDVWHEMSDSSDDTGQTAVNIEPSKRFTSKQSSVKTRDALAVIEESDWEEAEIIT